VLDFGPSELVSLELRWEGAHERLRRTESGAFELVEPPGFSHDPGLVLWLVQRLGTLEADRWVEARDGRDFGLEKPLVRVEGQLVKAGHASPFVLRIGAETAGGYYAGLDSLEGVFVVEKALANELRTLLIARDVFVFDPSEIDRIELAAGKRRIELERSADGFRSRAGTPELALPAVERLVARVTSLRAEAALHTGPARPVERLERPELTIEIVKSKPRPETVRLTFGAETDFRGTSVRFARRSGVNASFGVSQSSVRELLEAL
jgi:hypothetical protein